MANDADSDVVHLKSGEQLPAVPVSSPTTDMLKQLLEQMIENERRRLRNEYVRIALLFLVLLAVAIGGGLWFTHTLLDQLRAERQMTDRSVHMMLQRVASGTPVEPGDGRSAQPAPPPGGAMSPAPAPVADTNTVETQADIRRILSDLEATKRTLADLLKAQNAQTRSLLTSRDTDLQLVHERMQEMQRKIMSAPAPDVPPARNIEPPPAKSAAPSPAKAAEAVDSLTVTTSNAITLRVPIPSP